MKFILPFFMLVLGASAHAAEALVLVDASSFGGERLISRIDRASQKTELLRVDYGTGAPLLVRVPFAGALAAAAGPLPLPPGDGYMIARTHSYQGTTEVLATADSNARWRLSVPVAAGAAAASRPVEVDDCSVLLHLLESNGQYLLGGITESGEPMLRRWAGPGRPVQANLLKGQGAGEVSALRAMADGGALALVNSRNRTAELLRLDRNGRTVGRWPIAGGAANLGVDGRGRVMITYRNGKTVHAQVLDGDFKTLWQKALYTVSGQATATVQVAWLEGADNAGTSSGTKLEAKGSWWLLGANAGRLFALPIDAAGAAGTPLQARSDLLPPAEGQWQLVVDNGVVHLRGLSRTPADLDNNRMTEFHFELK